jgi:glutamate-1-semialdehyde 2,1-aminomutase
MPGNFVSKRPEVTPPTLGGERFDLGRELGAKAHRLIPGGAHTYAKGDDQFPEQAPGFIARGKGCHVWDLDGNEFIEYGMGLRAVALGHAYQPVVDAVMRQLPLGTNYVRPAPIEVECAERFLELVPTAEMVKFGKHGSDALDGAVKLARAYTGRDRVAICAEHPFFSVSDWFIGTTPMPAGIPQWVRTHTHGFHYNDLQSVADLFAKYPNEIACVILEAARVDEPAPGYLQSLKELCHRNGAVLVFDEMITGFRWHNAGAQHVYGVTPDLSTFGKAIANGFSLSALAGRREIMQLGSYDHDRERVFLMSTTHGAETHSLAAGIATMSTYRDEDVIGHLHRQGRKLRDGVNAASRDAGTGAQVHCFGRDCSLFFTTCDAEGKPNQPLRALFMQEMIRHGVLAPSFVISYSHTDADVQHTIDAVAAALRIYRKALEGNVSDYLAGRPVKPVFRPYR